MCPTCRLLNLMRCLGFQVQVCLLSPKRVEVIFDLVQIFSLIFLSQTCSPILLSTCPSVEPPTLPYIRICPPKHRVSSPELLTLGVYGSGLGVGGVLHEGSKLVRKGPEFTSIMMLEGSHHSTTASTVASKS